MWLRSRYLTHSVDLKTTFGQVFLLCGEGIQWKFAKQKLNARSTREVELITLDSTCTEAEWIRNLHSEILSIHYFMPLIAIRYDFKSPIDLSKYETSSNKMNRHM